MPIGCYCIQKECICAEWNMKLFRFSQMHSNHYYAIICLFRASWRIVRIVGLALPQTMHDAASLHSSKYWPGSTAAPRCVANKRASLLDTRYAPRVLHFIAFHPSPTESSPYLANIFISFGWWRWQLCSACTLVSSPKLTPKLETQNCRNIKSQPATLVGGRVPQIDGDEGSNANSFHTPTSCVHEKTLCCIRIANK